MLTTEPTLHDDLQIDPEPTIVLDPSTPEPAARPRTDLAGWLHLLRLGLARLVVSFVASLAFFALVLVPFPGFSASIISSGSMLPSIGVGDVVVDRALDEGTNILGRVVTARDPARPGRLLTHRVVISRGDDTYVTRGDANAVADPMPLARSDIRGRGFLLVPWIGLPAHWAATGQFVPLVLVVVGLGFAARWSVDRHVHEDGAAPAGDDRARRRIDRRRSVARLATAAVAVVAVLMPALTGRSAAAFTAATGNTGNNWAIAPDDARLYDDDGGRPLFDDTLFAGVARSRVITVGYEGRRTADVHLAAQDMDPALASLLHVRVERGAGGAFPDGSGFTPQAVVVAAARLSELAAGIPTGWTPAGTGSATFRITLWYPNAEGGPGAGEAGPVASAGIADGRFVWYDADSSVQPAPATANEGNRVAARLSYPDQVKAAQPYVYYRFDDAGTRGSRAANAATAANRLGDGTFDSWVTYASSTGFAHPPALVQAGPDVDRNFNQDNSDMVYGSPSTPYPNSVTVEAWVNVTSAANFGTIASFGSTQSAMSPTGSNDHRLYIGDDNRVRFGGLTGILNSFRGVVSPTPLTSGGWHLLQATMGPAGTGLYIDGVEVARSSDRVTESYNGYWRVGWQSQTAWPALSTLLPQAFKGGIDEVAVYDRVLDAGALRAHYEAGVGRALVAAAAAEVPAHAPAEADRAVIEPAEMPAVDAAAPVTLAAGVADVLDVEASETGADGAVTDDDHDPKAADDLTSPEEFDAPGRERHVPWQNRGA